MRILASKGEESSIPFRTDKKRRRLPFVLCRRLPLVLLRRRWGAADYIAPEDTSPDASYHNQRFHYNSLLQTTNIPQTANLPQMHRKLSRCRQPHYNCTARYRGRTADAPQAHRRRTADAPQTYRRRTADAD